MTEKKEKKRENGPMSLMHLSSAIAVFPFSPQFDIIDWCDRMHANALSNKRTEKERNEERKKERRVSSSSSSSQKGGARTSRRRGQRRSGRVSSSSTSSSILCTG